MRRPLRWVGVLPVVGLVLGGTFGFIASRTIGCETDGALSPNATCYRILGHYLSATTYYTAAAGLVGTGVGLVLGIFLALPVLLRRSRQQASPIHPLEVPAVWFGLQLVELFVLIPALLFWVPDPGVWPEAARISVWVVALVGITIVNYAIRRRYIPR